MVPKGCDDLQILPAEAAHVAAFRTTWVPYFLAKRAFDPKWNYRLFPWHAILVHPLYRTFVAADPNGGLEGMISFLEAGSADALYVAFLAAAPWNHGDGRTRRGVGAGLLGFAINQSIAAGHGGALMLSSTPESETFYERLGFERTGDVDDEGLPIFRLGRDAATALIAKYPPLR